MRNLLLALALTTIAGLLAFGAIACDDDNDGGGDETPVATEVAGEATEGPAEDTPEASGGEAINLSLVEYEIAPDNSSVSAGNVTLNSTNLGVSPHEVIVMQTDLDPAALPTLEDGSIDLTAEGIQVIGQITQFVADDGEQTFAVDLAVGAHVIVCNVVEEFDDGTITSHYSEGMFTPLEVTG